VRGVSLFSSISAWVKTAVGLWFVWLGYFFLIEEGIGPFHRIHHGIGLLVLLFVLVDAIRGFNDDLVESRRDTRKLTIILISLYMTVLTLVELFIQPLKDQWLFSLLNALMMLAFASIFVWRNLNRALSVGEVNDLETETSVQTQEAFTSPLIVRLSEIMAEGFYTQNALTISKLAKEIEIPEHKLRLIINKELGFDNFSQYLNSYRIPAIAMRLKNPEDKDLPILTLALEAGYNSIAPFNRAFKDLKGVTPSEYRRSYLSSFQK
jgi:AraC-like DNA-binding protein